MTRKTSNIDANIRAQTASAARIALPILWLPSNKALAGGNSGFCTTISL